MSLQQEIRKSRDRMKKGEISKDAFIKKWERKPSKIKKPLKIKRKK